MNALRHRNPTNHPTEVWDQVINAIPKSPQAHGDQCAFLKQTLVKPVRRMLDIGAGEGLFTATVLEILLQTGKLVGTLELHVLEAENRLWDICQTRLETTRSLLHDAGITLKVLRITEVQTLPRDTYELFGALERLKKAENFRYDLIVASHVSYYFHDGGIDFAYGVITRLLAKNGLAWFVVRDRNCPFYKLRKKLLLERGIPDINHHQFADSFISSLKSLFEGVRTTSRTMTLNLVDVSPEVRCRTIEYLTWLDGLGDNELSNFFDEQNGDVNNLEFREQHIWLFGSDKVTTENEDSRLQAAHALARCLNSIREICPDADVISASLAEIVPFECNDEVGCPQHGFIQEDHDKPIPLKGFGLIRYGFDGGSFNGIDLGVLDRYFREHTSFLYYPRFYIDHTSTCPVQADYQLSFHTTDETGLDGFITPSCYTTRLGRLEPVDLQTTVLERSTFHAALTAWNKLTGDFYLTDKTYDSSPGLWTFAVGAHLLPGGAFSFDDDVNLNSRCGLFLTIATQLNFRQLSGYVVGHIKTVLTQYLAQKVYLLAQDRLKQAEKASQLVRLLQGPLNGITTALDAMQRDAQELKAVLYEPSEALFRSYSRISHLFAEGGQETISNVCSITLHHAPEKYADNDELRALLCLILCKCCGCDKEMYGSSSFLELIERSLHTLSRIESEPTLQPMSKELQKLSGIGAFKEIRNLEAGQLCRAVANLKNALFTPFKLDSPLWPGVALSLIFSRSTPLSETRLADIKMRPEWTPLRYSTVLNFLIKVVAEFHYRADRATRTIERVTVDVANDDCRRIVIVFGGRYLKKGDAPRNQLKARLMEVLAFPRDWRINHATVGDFMTPFVELASHLLGIGTVWRAVEPEEDQLLQVVAHSRRFTLSVSYDSMLVISTMSLVWEPFAPFHHGASE
ncbi:MAG: class I SAM-dependent methyltransferase [Desulfuromonadaceae bacterium]